MVEKYGSDLSFGEIKKIESHLNFADEILKVDPVLVSTVWYGLKLNQWWLKIHYRYKGKNYQTSLKTFSSRKD